MVYYYKDYKIIITERNKNCADLDVALWNENEECYQYNIKSNNDSIGLFEYIKDIIEKLKYDEIRLYPLDDIRYRLFKIKLKDLKYTMKDVVSPLGKKYISIDKKYVKSFEAFIISCYTQ
jgi:ABC-type glycerol-3-phosphate transport system substrate-binding protein